MDIQEHGNHMHVYPATTSGHNVISGVEAHQHENHMHVDPTTSGAKEAYGSMYSQVSPSCENISNRTVAGLNATQAASPHLESHYAAQNKLAQHFEIVDESTLAQKRTTKRVKTTPPSQQLNESSSHGGHEKMSSFGKIYAFEKSLFSDNCKFIENYYVLPANTERDRQKTMSQGKKNVCYEDTSRTGYSNNLISTCNTKYSSNQLESSQQSSEDPFLKNSQSFVCVEEDLSNFQRIPSTQSHHPTLLPPLDISHFTSMELQQFGFFLLPSNPEKTSVHTQETENLKNVINLCYDLIQRRHR
ncbi:hypothetical protein C9374_003614 [Naegleria lovaniensis]|uniref:Uncharacterized protein n=1 Tax=Naegleria lovaniensis TaxID=51637 RepID=A0AA88KYB3_NAELO|nr:uncharacterized protein C9374_003614 [Naegleria lovaniensis]KAG2393850.1 hypothetical protein C9374_003614 [Naegleria lovaniensis]